MKQVSPNHPFSFQPMQASAQSLPYQQVAQQSQNIGTNTSTTTSGIMDLLKKIKPAGGNLTDTLDQIQKFLKMAQSVTPKIQEYGPLIKNLPAMLAMMNEMDVEEDSESEDSETKDNSTDVLDELLGLDKVEKKETQKTKKETIKYTNQGDNLYKIETITDQVKPKYQEPMLYI